MKQFGMNLISIEYSKTHKNNIITSVWIIFPIFEWLERNALKMT
jgi:hypothetical protein